MDVRAALTLLLDGTSLQVASDAGGTITLRSLAQDASSGTGAVSGRILNPLTGGYMRDARIRVTDVNGKSWSITSNERGEFRIVDLPAGEATLSVSFTGYDEHTQSVMVEPGETLNIDISMRRSDEDATLKLGAIAVYGDMRDGDARAIMRQRESKDIINSLSSESFGDIAEGNVGEFLKYMPGVDTVGEGDDTVRYVRLRGLPPEYTSDTVNGVNLAAADANGGSSTSRLKNQNAATASAAPPSSPSEARKALPIFSSPL